MSSLLPRCFFFFLVNIFNSVFLCNTVRKKINKSPAQLLPSLLGFCGGRGGTHKGFWIFFFSNQVLKKD